MTLAQYVKEFRLSAKLSQNELARMAGLTGATIARIEREELGSVLGTLVKLNRIVPIPPQLIPEKYKLRENFIKAKKANPVNTNLPLCAQSMRWGVICCNAAKCYYEKCPRRGDIPAANYDLPWNFR